MNREKIRRVVIAGGGLMGAGISQMFPQYGFETALYSLNESDFEKARQVIDTSQQVLVENGKLTAEQSEKIKSAIRFTTGKDCFSDADLVIEAIPENINIKKAFYEEISSLVREDTILTSNTSAISIDQLSAFVSHPERFCGTHFLNPPHIIPLVEITKGEKTSQETCDTLYDLFMEMKKQPVRLKKDVKGFLSNRLQFALLREATYLVENGVADPEDIDRTIKYGNGLRYTCSGPFKIVDLGGIQVFRDVARYLYPDLSNENRQNSLLEKLAEHGDLGISTGAGFYKYGEGDLEKEEKQRDQMILRVLNE